MPLTPDEIEKLRENSHIRLDREGRFWHEGALVEHPRVAEAFHRGLARAPDGRPTITFGRTWCYIETEGVLYLVRTAIGRLNQGGALTSAIVRLDDGSEETVALTARTVGMDGSGVLYLRVKAGKEWARLLPPAQAELGRYVDADEVGGLGLRTAAGFLNPTPLEF
jgi:hypothetical protein